MGVGKCHWEHATIPSQPTPARFHFHGHTGAGWRSVQIPVQKHGNALRSGNADVTSAIKCLSWGTDTLGNPRISAVIIHLSLQFSFTGSGGSSYAAPRRGFPLGWVGWLPSDRWPSRWRVKIINGQQARIHTEGHPGTPDYLSTQGMTGSLDDHQLLQYLKKVRDPLEYLLHWLKHMLTVWNPILWEGSQDLCDFHSWTLPKWTRQQFK